MSGDRRVLSTLKMYVLMFYSYIFRNPDLNHLERGLGRTSQPPHIGQPNEYESTNHPYNQYRAESDIDSDILNIRGVPQEPARHPDHELPPRGFDRCHSYKSNSGGGGSRRGSEASMNSKTPVPRQRTLSSSGRQSDCEEGTMERRSMRTPRTPRDSVQRSPRTPRSQRTPRGPQYEEDYLEPNNSMNRAGNRGQRGHPHMNGRVGHHQQYPSSQYPAADHRGDTRGDPRDYGFHTESLSPRQHPSSPRRMDESPYQTPRRIIKHGGEHDAASSDSGVQHLMYNGH